MQNVLLGRAMFPFEESNLGPLRDGAMKHGEMLCHDPRETWGRNMGTDGKLPHGFSCSCPEAVPSVPHFPPQATDSDTVAFAGQDREI